MSHRFSEGDALDVVADQDGTYHDGIEAHVSFGGGVLELEDPETRESERFRVTVERIND